MTRGARRLLWRWVPQRDERLKTAVVYERLRRYTVHSSCCLNTASVCTSGLSRAVRVVQRSGPTTLVSASISKSSRVQSDKSSLECISQRATEANRLHACARKLA